MNLSGDHREEPIAELVAALLSEQEVLVSDLNLVVRPPSESHHIPLADLCVAGRRLPMGPRPQLSDSIVQLRPRPISITRLYFSTSAPRLACRSRSVETRVSRWPA